jgi:4-hydroxy-3-methylbut-2-enyl diphosphate reductase
LSVDDTAEIIHLLKDKFKSIKGPIKEDICYATTNRQKAVKKIAPQCDMFFIIGSRNSSNSVRLVEVAKKAGCKNSLLMHFGKELPIKEIKKCNKIGISSGASAPEQLVQNLINNIRKSCNVSIEEIIVAEEKVVFKLPKELN